MVTHGFVGRVCMALGICLVLLAFGAYQAQANCSNDVCETGGCVGGDPNNCANLGCTSATFYRCRGCQCSVNPITEDHCNCTY